MESALISQKLKTTLNKPNYYQLCIFLIQYLIQRKEKSDRVNRFISYIDVNVTLRSAKEINIFFSQNDEMDVDNNYFFHSKPKVFSSIMIDSFRDIVSMRTENQKEALLINLMLNKNKLTISVLFM